MASPEPSSALALSSSSSISLLHVPLNEPPKPSSTLWANCRVVWLDAEVDFPSRLHRRFRMKRDIMIDVILGKNCEKAARGMNIILTHLRGIRIATHFETTWISGKAM